jgi:homeobox protein ESX1
VLLEPPAPAVESPLPAAPIVVVPPPPLPVVAPLPPLPVAPALPPEPAVVPPLPPLPPLPLAPPVLEPQPAPATASTAQTPKHVTPYRLREVRSISIGHLSAGRIRDQSRRPDTRLSMRR